MSEPIQLHDSNLPLKSIKSFLNFLQKIPKILEDLLHHLGTTTQVEFQESALSMQQANQNSVDIMSALDETKLLSDSIRFPDA